jgi:hypothetical protein
VAVQTPGPVTRLLDKATFDAAVGTRDAARMLNEIGAAVPAGEKLELLATVRQLDQSLGQADRRGAYPLWLHTHLAPLTTAFMSFRVWQDGTGTYKTEAQLVAVTAEAVTLAKTEGTQVRVPLAKLGRPSLNQVWALATCGALLATVKPAEVDAQRSQQIARVAEAISRRAEAPADAKSAIPAWRDRAQPRNWGQFEGRYLGTGKHDDGSAWAAFEKNDGQQVFCFAHELPAVCRATIKQLETSGETILRTGRRLGLDTPVAVAQAPPPAADRPRSTNPFEDPDPTPLGKPVPAPTDNPDEAPMEKPVAVPADKPEQIPTEKPVPPPADKTDEVPADKPEQMAPEEPAKTAEEKTPAPRIPEESAGKTVPEATPTEPAAPGPRPAAAPANDSRTALQARVEASLRQTAKQVPLKLTSVMQSGEGEEVAAANQARASYLKLMGYCQEGWETRKLPVEHDYFKQPEAKQAALDLAANILEKVLVWEGEDPSLRTYFQGLAGDAETRDLLVAMTLQILDQFGDQKVFLGLPYEDVASQARSRLLKKFQANGWRPKTAPPPADPQPPRDGGGKPE